MRFRVAKKYDVFTIIKLYQKGHVGETPDPLFLDYRKIEDSIKDSNTFWILCEINGSVKSCICNQLDPEQRLCKINWMITDPDLENSDDILRENLKFTLHYLENNLANIDLVFTTTLSISMRQQAITLEEGFKIVGVFPNVIGEDTNKMNGLSVYYFNSSLLEKRQKLIQLHEKICPFFEIAKRQCELTDTPQSLEQNQVSHNLLNFDDSPLPDLEVIRAEKFVKYKFNELKRLGSQVFNFYPFYEPNCLIIDPKEEIEIFLKITQRNYFAAIIGEHLKTNVDPVKLYLAVQEIIKSEKISYIEIINDALDSIGIECILRAGFTPCAYVPSFKLQGETRRDYVVFGKSFEYLCRPTINIDQAYNDFYNQYFKIEGANYFPVT